MKKKIVFWLPAVNPYWLQRIEFLSEHNPEIEVNLIINRKKDRNRDWEFEIPEYLKVKIIGLDLNPKTWARYLISLIQARKSTVITFHYRIFCFPIIIFSKILGSTIFLYLEDTSCNGMIQSNQSFVSSKTRYFIKKVIFSFANSILVAGPGSAQFASNWVEETKIKELPHVILEAKNENSRIKDTPVNLREKKVEVLFVGHLTQEKGFDLILQLIPATQHFLKWNICGEGSLKLDLLKLQTHFTTDVFEYHGFLQQNSLMKIYDRCVVLLLPSKHDTYALVVDEAMSRGVIPIVSGAIGDIDWRVKDRGIIVANWIFDVWVQELTSLIQNESQMHSLSQNCRTFMAKRDGFYWSNALLKSI